MKTRLALLLVCLSGGAVAAWAAPVALPIEVMGPAGTVEAVGVSAPGGAAATKLWLQIHNLSYQAKASVQVNTGAWLDLRNDNTAVAVAEPGKGFGGIGGAFQSLKLTVNLAAGSAVNGSNTVRFRFNQTDGRSSGFRVLAFNLLDAGGAKLIATDAFAQEDPAAWTPPRTTPADYAAGSNLWHNAALVEQPGGAVIQARCASCHATTGRDLKYFNFSNKSLIERSKFHGLSQTQSEQIASYIRALPYPAPGRPWNPPYQPGPGLDDRPVSHWAAGAGLEWALDRDVDAQPYLPGGGTNKSAHVDANRRFESYNRREIPLVVQFLDWNHWLPVIHPLDSIGANTFTNHGGWTNYTWIRKGLLGQRGVTREQYTFGSMRADMDLWKQSINGDDSRVARLYDATGNATSQANYTATYAAGLWSGVKLWEMMQEFSLEERGLQFYGLNGEPRQWFANRHIFNFAPHIISNTDTRDKLVVGDHDPLRLFDYLSHFWYEIQLVLNPGARNYVKGGHHDDDWKYLWYFSGEGNDVLDPVQAVALAWKAVQEVDCGHGPDGRDNDVADNSWWGFSLRDGRPEIGDVFGTWPAESQGLSKPLLQPLFAAWVEKLSTFTFAQWQKANPTEFYRSNNYVWNSSDVNESVPDQVRLNAPKMRTTFQLDEALINGYLDWGKYVWPSNDWNSLRSTPAAPIATPAAPTATPGVERVTLSWAAVAGATSYNVKRSDASNGVFLTCAFFVNGTSFSDPLLEPGRTYYYKISANAGREVTADSALSSATPQFGLVARWTFDEPSGLAVRDVSAGAIHGRTISNPARVAGRVGSALDFNGSNSFVSLPQNLWRWLGADATLTFWVKTTQTGNSDLNNAPGIVGARGDPGGDAGVIWGAIDNTGRIGVSLNNGAQVKSASAINNNAWRHVAITRESAGGQVKIYVDGALSTTGNSGAGRDKGRAWSLGRIDYKQNYFRGALDDVRIYNRVLSAAEVTTVAADLTAPAVVNAPPTIELNLARELAAPESIALSAHATDTDGGVASVKFYDGDTLLGTDASNPFAFAWTSPVPGLHFLSAVVTDFSGASVTSAPVALTIYATPHGSFTNALIATGATWKFRDHGSDQGTAWRATNFNDSAWTGGPSKLGFGDPATTAINIGPSPNRYVTTYFRHRFVVSDPAGLSVLTCQLLRDDGAVVYVNNVEAFRSNMPGGAVNYLTLASGAVGGTDETNYFTTMLDAALLMPGTNVIAVELHQFTSAGSPTSDAGFDLRLTAVGTAPQPPAWLSVTRVGNQLELTWPAAAAGYLLESKPALDAANWTPVPGQPQFVNGRFLLTQPVATPAQFYRLRQP